MDCKITQNKISLWGTETFLWLKSMTIYFNNCSTKFCSYPTLFPEILKGSLASNTELLHTISLNLKSF